jgi:hypothetical protein
MTERQAPFRLDEGIWLEDLNEVIPWGTKVEDLRRSLSPEIKEQSTSIHLHWKNHVCLGLSGDLVACRLLERPNPRAYHIYLETFHFAVLEWHGERDWSIDEITHSFKSSYERLRQSLGEATFSYPEYAYSAYGKREGSLPAIFWELPLLAIGFSATFPPHLVDHKKHLFPVAEFGATFCVSVQHEPPGYDGLKAEARLIKEREGEGARVNYVAW